MPDGQPLGMAVDNWNQGTSGSLALGGGTLLVLSDGHEDLRCFL
jgi:hypothetical protein